METLVRAAQVKLEAVAELTALEVQAAIEELAGQIAAFDTALDGVATEEFVTNTLGEAFASDEEALALSAADKIISPATLKKVLYDLVVPVGLELVFFTSTDPNVLYPGTVWIPLASGAFVVNQDTGDENFTTLLQTGGQNAFMLSAINLLEHDHKLISADPNEELTPSLEATNYIRKQQFFSTDDQNYRLVGSATVATLGKTASYGTSAELQEPVPTVPKYVVGAIWRRTV